MKIKGKKTRSAANNSGMAKMGANNHNVCLRNGTRYPCAYHCKKCYFEIMYYSNE